ncbi:MAG: hypothetical protein GQ538_08905 [Xanthomonadales bacterium]|nr:hypothetical protein [Xanthomonadales bacterium]
MNKRQITRLLGLALITVAATSSADTKLPKEKESNFPIVFNIGVNGAGVEALIITSPEDNNCINEATKGKKNGCFRVGKDKVGLVKITFDDDDGDGDDSTDAYAAWELKEFTVCAGYDKTVTCSLNYTQRLEFAITDDNGGIPGTTLLIPSSTGVIDLTVLGATNRSFLLVDQNILRGKYHYDIKVCPPSPFVESDCLKLDPPVENKGRK